MANTTVPPPTNAFVVRMPTLEGICNGELGRLQRAYTDRTIAYFPSRDPRRFNELFSLEAANAILESPLVRAPMLKIVGNGDVLAKSAYTVTVPVGTVNISDVVDPYKVSDAFAGGYTIVIQGAQTFWPPIRKMVKALESEITHEVQVNIYITPPRTVGAEVHYDTHDVLVLQAAGVKTWEIGAQGFVEPLNRHPHVSGSSTISANSRTLYTLNTGDVLFVPRGFLHRCTASSEISIHLTIGLLPHTAIDLLDYLIEDATDVERFRRSLPLGFTQNPSLAIQIIEQVLADFATWIQDAKGKTVLGHELNHFARTRRVPDAHPVLRDKRR